MGARRGGSRKKSASAAYSGASATSPVPAKKLAVQPVAKPVKAAGKQVAMAATNSASTAGTNPAGKSAKSVKPASKSVSKTVKRLKVAVSARKATGKAFNAKAKKASMLRRAAAAKAAQTANGGADSDDPDGVVGGMLAQLREMVHADGSGGDEGSDFDELLDALADVEEIDEILSEDAGSDSEDDLEANIEGRVGVRDAKGVNDKDDDEVMNGGGSDDDDDGEGDDDGDDAEGDDDGDDAEGNDDGDDAEGDDYGDDAEGDKDEDDAEDDEEDDDVGTLCMHKGDLEELKKSDPSFYKYLQENDASLLDVEDDEDDVAVGVYKGDAAADADDDGDENSESSGEEGDGASDDDAAEEADAAAEAGLIMDVDDDDVSDDEDANGGDTAPRVFKIVDMTVVRDLEKQLSLSRGAFKAAKDLMRMFRAGRELTAVAQGNAPTKAQQNKSGKRRRKEDCSDGDGDDGESDDEYVDDGSFAAGKVKFATARVYQKVMYLAIVRVQETLDKTLGKPNRSGTALAARWTPNEHSRWKNLEPMFTSYVSQMLSLTTGMKDASTLRFLLKRSELLVPYTRGNVRLAKRLIRLAINVWTSETRDVSEATKLRAYLLLRCIADEPSNVETVLRAVYNSFYTGISRTCNPRTMPNIMFAAKCIVDLFGVDMAASYTVAFSYLREMAVTLRCVLTSKDRKEDADKVHNWSFINSLRLLAMILSTYGAESELRPLIYPYVQIAIGVMRVQPTPRTYPMRLHIASYLTIIVSSTGVYVPVSAHLFPLLRCGELHRKPARGVTKDLEWRALLRVSDDTVKTKPYLTGLVNGTVLQLSAFYAAVSRHVSFPELSHEGALTLRKFAKDVKVGEWRASAAALGDKIRENAKIVADARARADFGPHGAAGTLGMLEIVPGLEGDRRMPVQRFYDVEVARVKREESMRDEGLVLKEETKRREKLELQGKDRKRSLDEDEEEVLESGSDSEADSGDDDDEDKEQAQKERLKAARQSKKARSDRAAAAMTGVTCPMFQVGKSGKLNGVDGYESDIVGDLAFSSDEE
jgi:nucleolar complex protein 2